MQPEQAMSVPSPSAQRLGSAVLLQGPALAEVLHLTILGAKQRASRNGIGLSAAHLKLITLMTSAVNDAPMSPTRRRHVAPELDAADSQLPSEQPVGSAEAARLLGLSTRQIQRRAAELGGYRVAGRLVFDRSAVVAVQAQRRETTDSESEGAA